MELRLLRYFVAVAEELHFNRAAQRLHMAQPPLSQQIRRLEEELGVALLSRDRHHVALTEPGRHFLGSAREILAAVARAGDEVRRVAQGELGRIRIGIVGSAPLGETLPAVLRAYRERCPAVGLTLLELSTGEQLEALHQGRIEVGFLRPPVHDPEIALTPLLREPLVAVVPEHHPLARRRSIPLRALAAEPFIMIHPSHGLGLSDLTLAACRQAGFTPRVSQEAREIQTIIGLVAAGFGVSLVSGTARAMAVPGVAYLSLSAPRSYIEIAAAHRAADDSPTLGRFLEVLHATLGETES